MSRSIFQLFVVIFLSFFTIDFAFCNDSEGMYVSRLKGWEGIAFQCMESTNIKNSICKAIDTDAEFLATASGVKFSKGKEFIELYDLQNKKNFLIVEVTVNLTAVSLTNAMCRTCALMVRLKAYAFYTHGIDINRDNLSGSPKTIPKSGDFVFWESNTGYVFTDTFERGSGSVIENVEKELKDFFILFMKANPK